MKVLEISTLLFSGGDFF